MVSKEYYDGLAFYIDETENVEIAFYSKFTDRITYNNDTYHDFKCCGCSALPFKDNEEIIKDINEYRKRNLT